MAGSVPPESGEPDQPRWQDRDTEPIPRARHSASGPDPDDDPDYDDEMGEPFAGGPAPGRAPRGGGYYDDELPQLTADEFSGLRDGGSGGAVYTGNRVAPLDDEPSKQVARYLFPTEKFRGEWKRHWIQLVKEFSVGALATILMGYVTGWLTKHNQGSLRTAVLAIWAVIIIWVAWKVADWWFDRFILTNKRVMVVSGIFTRNVAMMPLLRVTDMKYVQSPLGRLLSYGHFELESAGQDQALRNIKNLPNPNELYLRIVEEMYEPEAVEARLGRAQSEEASDGT
jgi:membrane protein YdbS with pleckstrin-like domain